MAKIVPYPSLLSDTSEYRTAESRDYLVVKHNDIIQRRYFEIHEEDTKKNMSLLEQKILLYVISRIKPDDTELKEQTFELPEFCRVCGIAIAGTNYQHIKDAIRKLSNRTMWLCDDEVDTTVKWIAKATIYKKTGKVKIRLDEDMIPYLLLLKENYTMYPLHSIIKMNTKYGILLYELLKSYCYRGEHIEFSVDELKKNLDCMSYDKFANIRIKVLEPAIKDINTYSELKVSAEYKKTGRSFTSVVFHVVDLGKSKKLEDIEEATRRYHNVEKDIYKENIFDTGVAPGEKEQ